MTLSDANHICWNVIIFQKGRLAKYFIEQHANYSKEYQKWHNVVNELSDYKIRIK